MTGGQDSAKPSRASTMAAGMPWEEFLRRRVLDPLGMTSTRFLNGYLNGHDPTPLGEQLAIGYQRQGERLVRWLSLFEGRPSLEEAYGRPCGPNGSVVSCVGDLCQWLRLQLNGGMAPDGNQIISKESLAEIHTPQVVVPQWSNSPWPELLDACYGFGWGIQPYRGRNWIFHDGNNCGFNAHISLLPADGLGVVLLTNVSQSPLVRMVPFEVFDRLLDVPDVGWNRRFKQSARQIKARQALAAGKVGNGCAAVANLPSTDLSAYAGRYHNPGYGTMHLRAKQGRLEAVYNRFVIRFRCAGKDFFKSVGTAGGGGMKAKTARFRRNRVGRITGVAIPMTEDAQELEIVFNKKDREA